jgi:hypothetical protein
MCSVVPITWVHSFWLPRPTISLHILSVFYTLAPLQVCYRNLGVLSVLDFPRPAVSLQTGIFSLFWLLPLRYRNLSVFSVLAPRLPSKLHLLGLYHCSPPPPYYGFAPFLSVFSALAPRLTYATTT